jgi:5-methylthioadenosine/S-adenosylhomocysteine deaminase
MTDHKKSRPAPPRQHARMATGSADTGSGAIRLNRRHLLLAAAAGLTASATSTFAQPAADSRAVRAAPTSDRILLRNGCVLSMDPQIGDFDRADVLIEAGRISAIAPDLAASGDDLQVIDATGMIIMPGFVDTHRHMWQGPLRSALPDGLLSDYTRDITGAARAVYRPQDAYAGDLISALGALNAGITNILDWSHIGNSPEHTDAAIAGLRESGIRGVYAFGGGTPGADNRFPDDIHRLRREHFASDDQLLTLAMAAGTNPAQWSIARDVGAFISVHIVGSMGGITEAAMGPDVTYIHCTNLSPDAWRMIADTGGHVSIAGPIEMQMRHGNPPIQEALDVGIRPSLSVDVETQQPADFFSQMHSVFSLQRMFANERHARQDDDAPELLSVRDVVEFATLRGAVANQLDHRVGSLTPGKDADVIMLDMQAINVLPVNNAYGAIVLGMDTSNVDTVFVAGRARKFAGRLLDVDLDRVARLAAESREHVLSAAGWTDSRLGDSRPGS